METGTTIIGVVLLALCILPFLISGYLNRKRKIKMLKSLNEYAKQNLCSISKFDIGSNMVIASDDINRCIFFCKKNKEKSDKIFVDLNKIKNCMILSNNNPMKYREGSVGDVEKLELSFLPLDNHSSDVKMEFYNSAQDIRITNEMKLAEKWQNLINEMLKGKTKK